MKNDGRQNNGGTREGAGRKSGIRLAQIPVRLEGGVLARVRGMAVREGVTLAVMLRELITSALERKPAPKTDDEKYLECKGFLERYERGIHETQMTMLPWFHNGRED